MPKSTVKTTCCYCGVGCGVLIDTVDGAVSGVRGDPDHPSNRGELCAKGSALHLTTGVAGRLLYPELRTARTMERQRTTWNEALDHMAAAFARTIGRHGPDAIAFYVSGQLLTEDYYAFNKLARAIVGTNNIDSNSRLCMSSAVAGYKQSLGADGPPGCYEDIEASDCVLIAGSNAAWAHPILFRRLEAARARKPEAKLIVVDPRRTATAAAADLHLAIEPGTDVALFHGLLHVLIWEDLVDADYIARHTEGYDALKTLAREYTPREVARVCGIAEADIVTAARWFGQAHAALSLYCMGLNQSSHGTDKNTALINLHLATGQIARPGAGPFSLTGQPNAMGGREVGAMANLYPGHREVTNPGDRAELARYWNVASLPAAPGKTAIEMFEAVRDGGIKIVWIACTNPAHSIPDQAMVRAALEQAELVIVQDAYAGGETAAYADVLLPAATWAEKDGTMTNSERRLSRVRPTLPPPGAARQDWDIVADFACRLERRLRPDAVPLMAGASAQALYDEHRGLTRDRDLDISQLTYAILDRDGPQQWPYRPGTAERSVRLYEDSVYATPGGRACFVAAPYRPVAEAVDARYPFRLVTARLRDQWHGMSRTGRVPRLHGHGGEPAIAMHPADLARRALRAGELVHVDSRRGRVTLSVEPDNCVQPGTVSLAMHWGARLLGGAQAQGINAVTLPVYDRVSRQPELKHCSVRIVKAELGHQLVAFAAADARDPVDLLAAASRLLVRFDYAHCVMFASTAVPGAVLASSLPGAVLASSAVPGAVLASSPPGAVLASSAIPGVMFAPSLSGVMLRAAHATPLPAVLLAEVDALFGLAGDDVLRYDDARLGVGRRIRLGDDRIAGVRLYGDTAAEAWLKELLLSQQSVATLRRMLLAPTMPSALPARGKVVCSCWNVALTDIERALEKQRGPDALAALQEELKCGTSCGSCVPELRQLVARRATPEVKVA